MPWPPTESLMLNRAVPRGCSSYSFTSRRWAVEGPRVAKRAPLLAAICFGVSTAAFPCDCVRLETPAAETIERSAAVFEGKVLQVRLVERPILPDEEDGFGRSFLRVRLRVSRAWKGVDQPEIEVSTDIDEVSCGFPFRVARSYLVFADGEAPDSLRAHYCGYTHLSIARDPALETLGAPNVEFPSGPAGGNF